MSSLRLLLLRGLACAIVFAALLTSCGDAFRRPAAVVNGAAITDDSVRATLPLLQVFTALQNQPCGTASPGEPARSACARVTLTFLIGDRITARYAAGHDVRLAVGEVRSSMADLRAQVGSDQLDADLRRFGVTSRQFEGFARRYLLFRKVGQEIASRSVTDEELRAEYERRKLDFTELHAAHILVGSREEADRIARKVTPDNFADLARRFSRDQGSAQQGGDLGPIPAGRLDPDFVQAALALEPGEISDPVQTRFGWHIILLISVRVASFEQAREQLVGQLAGPAFQRWLERRFRVGDIEVNPRYGRFDPATGEVLPLDSTATGAPSPTTSGGPPAPVPS